jgi:integrase
MTVLNQNSNMVLSLKVNAQGEMPMYMKLINGRWYSNIWNPKNPKKRIQVSLDAYKHEKRKASVNLGAVIADIQKGINPTSARQKINKLVIEGKVTQRTKDALKHIDSFFGEYKPRDVDEKLIGKYIESRFGLSGEGELQAYKNTLDKELLALQRKLQSVYGKGYRLERPKYKNMKREILDSPTLEQIEATAEFIEDKYKAIYWTMAYTGMDVSDVVYLTPGDFKDGWIIKKRGKTTQEIAVPVCDPLADILKAVPWPLSKDARIFPEGKGRADRITPDGTATHVRRCFTTAGFPGYGSKYLRRFVGSILLDKGYSEDWIGKALAHADGSKETKKYTKVYKATLEEAFGKIKKKEVV